MSKLAAVVVAAVVLASCQASAPQIVFKYGETRGRLQKNGVYCAALSA